jgi:hypothetical protein
MGIEANTHLPPIHSLKFFSGYGGRVQATYLPANGANQLDQPPTSVDAITLAWVKNWNCEISVEVFGADTFENPLNARGLPFKRKDLLGLASGKVDLEGFSMSNNLIQYGSIYAIELVMGRVTGNNFRKIRVFGLCSSVSRSASADGNSPVEFKASFEFASPPAFVVEAEA